MADFTVHIPDAFVPRLVGPVDNFILAWESHPIMAKILAYLGVPEVASLTAKQRGEVFCQCHLWKSVADVEVSEAATTAMDDARQAVEDDFEPGT